MATLTSIPPELLLQIITHLPSSIHFLPLTQTSRSLRTFFTTHASTICNTHITTYHAAASSILLSIHHSSGWLVPTHPCVLAEERRILRDKIILSNCACYECRLFLLSSRSASGSGSSLTLSEMNFSSTGGMFNCIPRTPVSSAACKATPSVSMTTKLTTPGPQYLVFLEKYGLDIEIRNSMRANPYKSSSESGVREISLEEREKSRFDFMVGNYSVRRFLEDVEQELQSFESHLEEEYEEDMCTQELQEPKRKRVWKAIKEKLGSGWDCLGKKKKYHAIPAESEPPRPNRPLMFGEIEKVDFEPRRESWVKGFLWYHAAEEISDDNTPPASSSTSNQQPREVDPTYIPPYDPDKGGESHKETNTTQHAKISRAKWNIEKARESINGTAAKAKCKIGRAWRAMTCGEGFLSLDD